MDLVRLKSSIRGHEKLSLKVYTCPAGVSSIGYGRNLVDNGISKQEAEIMLENDLLDIKLELEDKLSFFNNLNDVRQEVITEMAYNMGVPRLLKFEKTLEYIKNKEFEKASVEMLDSKWHRDFVKWDMQDGKRTKVLRSEYLSQLMKKGEY